MNEPLESLHLDAQRLEAYRNRTLAPAALLAAADHLAECAECRARAAAEPPAIGHLRDSLEPAHLTEAELEAFAEDSLSDPDACEHMAACARCADDAHDLRRFVRTNTQAAPSWWRRLLWPVAAAAAVCAASLAAWLVTRAHPPSPLAAVAPIAAHALPSDLRQLVDTAIASGHVAIPSEVAALRGAHETQLGGAAPQAAAELESPLATATLSPRPEFRWNAVPRAQSYRVAIFDSEFRPIASSPVLQDTHWTPPADLASGVAYNWDLTIFIGGAHTTAPRPPAPAARFLVLNQADRVRLTALAAHYPQEHLLLGVLFAQAGVLDDARREWQTAQAQGNSQAAKLLTAR